MPENLYVARLAWSLYVQIYKMVVFADLLIIEETALVLDGGLHCPECPSSNLCITRFFAIRQY